MNRLRMLLCGVAMLFYSSYALTAAATNLSGRIDYAISYFPPASAIIMHGGWGKDTNWEPLNELWKLDGSGWSSLAADNSPSMARHSMTYDSIRQVLIICGRKDVTSGTDFTFQTWEYDGTSWAQKADIPVNIDGDVKIAYDANRNVTVLYGGGLSKPVVTLEYDGTSWTQKSPAHQPVDCAEGALLNYDEKNKKTVLVGNKTSHQGPSTETWTWDGTDWTQVAGTQPDNAVTGGMAFDSQNNEMVLITTNMLTWTFDGTEWSRKSPAVSPTPSPSSYFGLAFDTHLGIVFFGGEARSQAGLSYPVTTWQWNGSTWTEFTPPSPTGSLPGLIIGYITDADTGDPIANATVTIGTSNIKTLPNGMYAFFAPAGPATLTVKATGYSDYYQTAVTFTSGSTLNKNIKLKSIGSTGEVTNSTYTVTASVSGGNGTISCTTPVNSGGESNCAISPDSGYHLDSLTDNATNVSSLVSGNGYVISNITADHAVAATFAKDAPPVIQYTITTSAVGGHGSISCTTPVTAGESSKCTITPESGFKLSTLTDNGTDTLSSAINNIYTIPNVTADHTLTAVFTTTGGTSNRYTLTVTKSRNNTVKAKGLTCSSNLCTGNYVKNKAITLTAKPSSGFKFMGWSGACTGAKTYCTVKMTSDKITTATFGKPDMLVSQNDIDLANTAINQAVTATLAITNNGDTPLVISSFKLTGKDAKMFSISNSITGKAITKATIAAGGSLSIIIKFKPTSVDSRSATLKITSNDPYAKIKNVTLSGTGT